MDTAAAVAQLRAVWNELSLASAKPVSLPWAKRMAAAIEVVRLAAAGVPASVDLFGDGVRRPSGVPASGEARDEHGYFRCRFCGLKTNADVCVCPAAREAARGVALLQTPVAEVREVSQMGEQTTIICPLVDAGTLPAGTKLYAHPAGVTPCGRCGAIEAYGEAHGSACTRGVWVDAPAALQPHRIARLAGHVNEMDSNGWKDAAETIRALIAAYGVLEVGRG